MKRVFLIYFSFFVALTSADWTPDPACPFPSEVVVRFPYPGDCTKYWECFEGTKYVQECPAGLEYNAGWHECDIPEIANCDESTGTWFPETSTSNWIPDPLCPYPSDVITYFPYQGDCTKFYECWHGNKYVYICPNGLYWHEEISECDYPENVNCNNGTIVTDATPTTKGSPVVSTKDPQCAAYPPHQIVYIPYPNDCSKFWECYEGFKNLMSCPAGLYWNQELLTCDFPEHVNCKN